MHTAPLCQCCRVVCKVRQRADGRLQLARSVSLVPPGPLSASRITGTGAVAALSLTASAHSLRCTVLHSQLPSNTHRTTTHSPPRHCTHRSSSPATAPRSLRPRRSPLRQPPRCPGHVRDSWPPNRGHERCASTSAQRHRIRTTHASVSSTARRTITPLTPLLSVPPTATAAASVLPPPQYLDGTIGMAGPARGPDSLATPGLQPEQLLPQHSKPFDMRAGSHSHSSGSHAAAASSVAATAAVPSASGEGRRTMQSSSSAATLPSLPRTHASSAAATSQGQGDAAEETKVRRGLWRFD